MATVLVAMLGYALLFTGLRLLSEVAHFPPAAIGVVGIFFAFVAVGQAVAIPWNSPRTASAVAGVVFWSASAVIAVLSGSEGPCDACAMLVTAAVFGPLTGYLAGALVGGVFLVSHHLREADVFRRVGGREEADAASPWRDPAAGEPGETATTDGDAF